MKTVLLVVSRFVRIVTLLALTAFLVVPAGCSSTHKIGKNRHGMVPCPCEKKARHR